MNKLNLYNFIFWFNPHEDLWYAIDRDTQLSFFNGNRKNAIYYKSKNHSTLVSILMKDGLAEKLAKTKPERKKTKA